MKRILVPVDFSHHTDISCRYAIELAPPADSEIILFYSFFDQFFYTDGGFATGFESGVMMTDEIILDLFKQKELKLQELVKELKSLMEQDDKMNIEISSRIESGNPEVQIIRILEQMKPDLVVMGSGGMGRKGLLAGSVARRIIDSASIPVVAVPELDRVQKVRNIAYMTTFNPGDFRVILKIEDLLSTFRVNIFCVHLAGSDPDPKALLKMNSLSDNQELSRLEGRISFHVLENDREEETLQNFVTENQIGLVAFIPHKRNLFRNLFYHGITREDLFQMQIPIMAVKAGT